MYVDIREEQCLNLQLARDCSTSFFSLQANDCNVEISTSGDGEEAVDTTDLSLLDPQPSNEDATD